MRTRDLDDAIHEASEARDVRASLKVGDPSYARFPTTLAARMVTPPESLSIVPSARFSGLQRNRLRSSSIRPVEPTSPGAPTLDYEGGAVIRRHQRSWTGVNASLAEVRCEGYLHVDLGSRWTRLSVVLEAVGGRFETLSNSWRGQTASHDVPRPLSLIPTGLNAHGQATDLRFLCHLVLQFDVPKLVPMVQDEIDLTDAFAPRLMFADAGIMHFSQLFAAECASDEPHSRLYGDNLSTALVLALSRLSKPKLERISHGQLSPWQLRRVTEYFFAHLADDIQLQQACDLVKLSRSYFSRAFKMSTGLAPHQWVLRARIDKAKQLLLECDRPLAQIAVDVGFADQAHFTRTFGRAVGKSPGAWQRACCT